MTNNNTNTKGSPEAQHGTAADDPVTGQPRAWSDCIGHLRERISDKDFNAWITPLHAIHHGDTLKLLAPNRFACDHVRKNLLDIIEEIACGMNNGIQLVKIEIGGHEGKPATADTAKHPTSSGTPRPTRGNHLDPDHTFAKHVEGDSNRIARAAAMQVGNLPGDSFNPLFIYGEVGLGKTHLMQAAGHLMRANNPNARVAYVHSELFVNDMVRALKNNTMHEFKHHYRTLDALLIDDIQFLAKKQQSQEEFFHTFNVLFEGQRQIIITSDRLPQTIAHVEKRLISRFSSGMTSRIDPPELETRVAIIERKAAEEGIELPDKVAFFVANLVRANVRELSGALVRILAHAKFSGRAIDVPLAREALQDFLAYRKKHNSIENIQQAVAEYYGVRMADLMSKRRSRNIARPRQMAMSLAKEYTSLSLPQIGDRFGGRDHTTVIHACRRIQELVEKDPRVREDHQNLQHLFSG